MTRGSDWLEKRRRRRFFRGWVGILIGSIVGTVAVNWYLWSERSDCIARGDTYVKTLYWWECLEKR